MDAAKYPPQAPDELDGVDFEEQYFKFHFYSFSRVQ
tara:strand:- start:1315 stop:1422 length:108 start_codon:yes stop_codon:yes gene_type:complete